MGRINENWQITQRHEEDIMTTENTFFKVLLKDTMNKFHFITLGTI